MPAAKKSVTSKTPAKAPARRRPATRKPAAEAAPARSPTLEVAPLPSVRKPADIAKPDKSDKPRKNKLLRDSFTIPKSEYAVLEALKERAAKAGHPAKKSEVLRAGVKALSVMGDIAFLAALGAVPAIKTGRPAKT